MRPLHLSPLDLETSEKSMLGREYIEDRMPKAGGL